MSDLILVLRRSYLRVVVLSLAVLVFVIMVYLDLKLQRAAVDDSLIHLRIAEMYARTGHAWYNPTERVMSTSSPVWTIFLAILFKLTSSFASLPLFEALFTAIAAAFSGLLVSHIFAAIHQLPSTPTRPAAPEPSAPRIPLPVQAVLLIVAAVGIASFCLAETAVSQMETPLAFALALAGLWQLTTPAGEKPFAFTIRPSLGLALIVLAAFTRFEFGLFAVLIGSALLLTRRAHPATFAAAAAAALLGCLWLWTQFHTLVPNTVIAKAAAYNIPATRVLIILGLKPGLVPLFAVVFCALLFLLIRRRALVPIPVVALSLISFGVLLATTYSLRHAWLASWYLPLVLLPSSLGCLLLVVSTPKLPVARILATVLMLWFLLIPVYSTRHLIAEALLGLDYPRWNDDYAAAARVHEYFAVGQTLYHACPNGSLLTSEIGGLGYGFRGEILDGVGLTTPAAIFFHPLRFPQDSPSYDEGAIPLRYARIANADLIATYLHHGEVVVQQAQSLGYDDIALPPFLRADHILRPEASHFGPMHILVHRSGACSLPQVTQFIERELRARF